jgi:cation transport regulator ChaC
MEHGHEDVLYFAYGSCMSGDFSRTVPEFEILGRGILHDYRLGFTLYAEGRQGGVADIVRNLGGVVEGVLYKFPQRYLADLDQREGVHKHMYRRIRVPVEIDGDIQWAWTYEVIEKAEHEIAPSDLYAKLVLDGAKEFLSEAYVARLSHHIEKLQQSRF